MPLLYQDFDSQVRNSYPRPVRALFALPETSAQIGGPRWDLAVELSKQGFAIDVPIMVWGLTPTEVYEERGLELKPPPLAADLIVTEQPFGEWPFNRAKGWYEPAMTDTSDFGAVYPNATSPTHQKQRLRVAFGQLDLWVKVA